jgi:hypothetical protein
MQDQWRTIRAYRSQIMHVMVWVKVHPTIGDEGSVDVLQAWMRALISPCEQTTMQMDYFQQRLGDEASELSHELVVKIAIVFVFRTVDNVEVTGEQP